MSAKTKSYHPANISFGLQLSIVILMFCHFAPNNVKILNGTTKHKNCLQTISYIVRRKTVQQQQQCRQHRNTENKKLWKTKMTLKIAFTTKLHKQCEPYL
jgi:hypothetical protein